jgi:trimeric autotransporter adhesin
VTRRVTGELFIAGPFSLLGNAQAGGLGRFDGASWRPLGPGIDNGIIAQVLLPDGRLVAGGYFTGIGDTAANRIAVWNGSQWAPLGSGMNGGVEALTVLPNGDLVAAGKFSVAGGIAAGRVARWNGSAWSAMGSLPPPESFQAVNAVQALLALPDGQVWAAGRYTGDQAPAELHRWDGMSWVPQPVTLGNGPRTALLRRPNGNLIAVNQCIQEWNGSQWLLRGCLLGSANAVALLDNGFDGGDIVIGGDFTNVSGLPAASIARWSGGLWFPFGQGIDGYVRSLAVLPNGDLLAGGRFAAAGGVPANSVARYRGGAWQALGGGVQEFFGLSPLGGAPAAGVHSIVLRGNELCFGGNFLRANGAPSAGFARLTTGCPAAIANTASGCSTGVAVALNAPQLPWLGSSFHADSSGLLGSALALDVLGFAPVNLLLLAVLPAALPGCTLLVQPDVLTLLPVAGDLARATLVIPNLPSLLGGQFFQQTLAIELAPAGSLQVVRASNRLASTIGGW